MALVGSCAINSEYGGALNTIKQFALSALGLLVAAQAVLAQSWVQTSAPSNYWTSIAASADGSQFVATASPDYGGDGLIYISTNSGIDWTPTGAPSNEWISVASSADGTKLIAAANGDLVYISTNSGVDWNSTSAAPDSWVSVASSSDGSKLLAAANGDLIYFSTNSGSDWTPADAPVENWLSIACSADGTTALAATGNQVWISKDSGETWTQTDLPSGYSVASSADGSKLAVIGPPTVSFGGHTVPSHSGVALSADAGVTWTINTNITSSAIVLSADGNELFIDGYFSTNFGTTWMQETNLSNPLACSADGSKLVVAELGSVTTSFGGHTITHLVGGYIYTSFTMPAPAMILSAADGNFTVSWIVPSTNFVMQQSADLQNWMDVTNPPVLNLTNLNDEVILPLTDGDGFFRLKTL